jgi:Tol biopolymer transport system component
MAFMAVLGLRRFCEEEALAKDDLFFWRRRGARVLRRWCLAAVGATCFALVFLSAGASAPAPQPTERLVVAGQDGLFLIDSNGKMLGHLTRGISGVPTWSPDGREVAFFSSQGLAIKPLGGATRVLRMPKGVRFGGSLSWSPDGKRLAYVGERKVVIVSRDGRSSRTLLQVPKGCGHIPPVHADFAPDGEHIAIARGCPSAFGPFQGIWLHDLRGRTVRQLVRHAWSPSWSPSGKQLAFDRDCETWILDIQSRRERKVGGGSCVGFDNRATWSPDEQRLAVDRFATRCGAYDRVPTTVTIVRLDTGAEHDLGLPCARRFSHPSWEPGQP